MGRNRMPAYYFKGLEDFIRVNYGLTFVFGPGVLPWDAWMKFARISVRIVLGSCGERR